ncbi:MAG: response regulator [Chloroflexota bacterium]|nr:response regulator [Chloroflexota bacterium]
MKRILYIEDDPVSRTLVRRILEARGYSVVEAHDGLSGLHLAETETPDLILIDINLPDLDGYAVTTKLRGLVALRNIPIIALTANVMDGDRERSLVSGCNGYIPKPIEAAKLTAQIEDFLGGHRETLADSQERQYLREYRDRLVDHLENKVKELTTLNAELERRVEERTAELRAAQEKLIEAEKNKTAVEMAGATAHELNQPLTAILGLIQLTEQNTDDEQALRQDLKRIANAAWEMADIVHKIGQITHYETKKYVKGVQIIDIDRAAQQQPPANR